MMKTQLHQILTTALIVINFTLNAQIIINEVQYEGTSTIELYNQGSTSVDVSSYWFCNFPSYTQISDLTIVSGATTIPANGFLVVSGFSLSNDAELGLYTSSSFGSSTAIVDYIEWGSTGHQRSSVAVAAGTWTTGNFITVVTSGETIQYDGIGDTAADYAGGTPTFNAANFNNTLSTKPIKEVLQLEVYPNPTSDILHLTANANNSNAILFNIHGKKVVTLNLSKQSEIDLRMLQVGIYVLEVETSNHKTATAKIIKK